MRHGYHISPESGRRYKVKTVKCLKCGKEVQYKTCPPDTCMQCNPNKTSVKYSAYQREYSKTRRIRRRADWPENQPVDTTPPPPGFCRCGLKLSVANRDGFCDSCHDEQLKL